MKNCILLLVLFIIAVNTKAQTVSDIIYINLKTSVKPTVSYTNRNNDSLMMVYLKYKWKFFGNQSEGLHFYNFKKKKDDIILKRLVKTFYLENLKAITLSDFIALLNTKGFVGKLSRYRFGLITGEGKSIRTLYYTKFDDPFPVE